MIALLRSILALSFVLSGAILACAETFPSRQVHLIVAYPAGGAADIIARSAAQRLSEMWSQTVVIENRAGGGTQIAASAVAQSPPDGYKLLVTGMETFAISPFLYSKLSYDPDKDFVPVSGFGYANQILTVPASSPLKSIGDLLAEARKGKSLLQYGTIGMGGSSHINMVLLESLAGVKLEPIHYRGGAPMLNDLVGAHVPMGFLSVTLVDQYIKVGTLRALGIGSKKRLPQLPDVPTIDESGVPGFEAVSWFGLFAPRGTPDDVVKKINADVQKVFADPDFQQKFLLPNFLNVIPGNPTEFEGYIKAEAAKWSQVIKGAHLHME
jgi:tripartite-type tricarboxylate transporter receptor subunit TctC